MTTDRVSVVFLGGMGRSGSTLLSRVLDRVPGFVSVGELCNLWNQGVLNNRACGCGRHFAECPFWSEVGDVAFGGWHRLDARAINARRLRVERVRHFPLLAAPRLSPRFARDLQEHAGITSRVYDAIRTVSGRSVIVDNSKKPSSAFLLHRLDIVDLRLVHLVRSPYGVSYSWAKHIARPDMQDQAMMRLPVRSSAARWMAFNVLLETLGRFGVPSMLVKYEEFVSAPRQQLDRILGFLDEQRTAEELAFIDDDSIDLTWDHSVWGNPMRVRAGREPVRLDEEWTKRLTAAERRTVTAITAPGLLRYGYLAGAGGQGNGRSVGGRS